MSHNWSYQKVLHFFRDIQKVLFNFLCGETQKVLETQKIKISF